MQRGEVVEQGTPDDIFHRPRHPYTRTLLSSVLNLSGEFPYEALAGSSAETGTNNSEAGL
jgi:peptide/nickel transport system ATP-binding protein